MKAFYFKNPENEFGVEFFVVSKSRDGAFFDLENYIKDNRAGYDDIDFWKDNPELVVELKLGDIVETQ